MDEMMTKVDAQIENTSVKVIWMHRMSVAKSYANEDKQHQSMYGSFNRQLSIALVRLYNVYMQSVCVSWMTQKYHISLDIDADPSHAKIMFVHDKWLIHLGESLTFNLCFETFRTQINDVHNPWQRFGEPKHHFPYTKLTSKPQKVSSVVCISIFGREPIYGIITFQKFTRGFQVQIKKENYMHTLTRISTHTNRYEKCEWTKIRLRVSFDYYSMNECVIFWMRPKKFEGELW